MKKKNILVVGAMPLLGSCIMDEETIEKVNKAFKEEVDKYTITAQKVDEIKYLFDETKSGKHFGKRHKHKNKKFF